MLRPMIRSASTVLLVSHRSDSHSALVRGRGPPP
jgi:hypothetical protein